MNAISLLRKRLQGAKFNTHEYWDELSILNAEARFHIRARHFVTYF